MNSRMRTSPVAAFSAACLMTGLYAAQAVAGGGPVSKYYMTAGVQDRVIRGGTTGFIEAPTNTTNNEYPMFVLGTMRTVGSRAGGVGSGYNKNLVFNGKSYTNNIVFGTDDCFDATTDGCFVYTVNHRTGEVIRANLNWSSPQVLFDAGGASDYLGITYDPRNHSLWLSRWIGGKTIENYDMQGNLLSSFAVRRNKITCLALDHKNGLLWVGHEDKDEFGVFTGYTRAGAIMGNIDYFFGLNNTLGGEFDLGATSKIKSVKVRKGEFLSGVRRDMNRSDTKRYRIRSETRRDGSDWMIADIKFKSTVSNPDEIDVKVVSRLDTEGGTCKVFLKNWNTGRWDIVDAYPMSTSDGQNTTYKARASKYVDSRGITVVRLCQVTFEAPNRGWKSFLNVVQVRVRE